MTAGARSIIAALALLLLLAVAGLAFFAGRTMMLQGQRDRTSQQLLDYASIRLNTLAVPPDASLFAGVPLSVRLQYLRAISLAAQQELRAYAALRQPDDDVEAVRTLLERHGEHLEAVALRTEERAQEQALAALLEASYDDLQRISRALPRPDEGRAEAGQVARSGAAAAYLGRPTRPLEVSTGSREYAQGEPVTIRVRNVGAEAVELPSSAPVVIYHQVVRGEWQPVYAMPGTEAIETLGPGQVREWTWDQRTAAGSPAPLGEYEVRVHALGWREFAFTARFRVG